MIPAFGTDRRGAMAQKDGRPVYVSALVPALLDRLLTCAESMVVSSRGKGRIAL